MKVAVIGGVSSTAVLVDKLAEHGFKDVSVWGYHPTDTSNVSGWVDLADVAGKHGYCYSAFVKVVECELGVKEYCPDALFVVGLSQIVPASILEIPRLGSVGFHPTALPRGRGRAPIAWLILNETQGAATFFTLREGVDDGPIVAQEFFDVCEDDDAKSIERKILSAEAIALDVVLKGLNKGAFEASEQDHSLATWYGRRSPEDGWIDWARSSRDISKLIRASADPHPGAFTYCDDVTIQIWKAQVVSEPIQGVVGRVLGVEEGDCFVVQCGEGLLRISDWSSSRAWRPRVGVRLGYYVESEIVRLRGVCADLQARIMGLESALAAIKSEAA